MQQSSARRASPSWGPGRGDEAGGQGVHGDAAAADLIDTHAYVHVHVSVSEYVYVYACMYVCVYIYIYIYTFHHDCNVIMINTLCSYCYDHYNSIIVTTCYYDITVYTNS